MEKFKIREFKKSDLLMEICGRYQYQLHITRQYMIKGNTLQQVTSAAATKIQHGTVIFEIISIALAWSVLFLVKWKPRI